MATDHSSTMALPPEGTFHNLPDHPRLFANAARWEEMRAEAGRNEISSQLFEIQRRYAETLMGQPAVALVREGLRLLTPIREALFRISTLASAARLTGDRRYVERALVEMRGLAALEDWNPSHYLDTAEAALALAIGYDWLYHEISPGERAVFEEALLRKALLQSYDPPDQEWVSRTNNWNQVCHGGMVAAALAVAERDPALARRVVERAIEKVPLVQGLYAPDGAYVEGPVYWQYGTTYHVILIEALRSALGEAFGLDRFPGFIESAGYIAQTTTPTGGLFNYADTIEEGRGSTAVLFWFARERKQPGILKREIERIAPGLAGATAGEIDVTITPFELLWWEPAAPALPPSALPLHWYARGETPIAVHRSAWDDSRAAFIGLKGGSPRTPHAHMDSGSFVIEGSGVRWAVDLGPQAYHSLEERGIYIWDANQSGDRWRVFRHGANAHNILRFNAAPQLVDGTTHLVSFKGEGDHPHTILDLTELYKDQVTRVLRGVSLGADSAVWIRDEWTAGDKPVDAAWQWLTRAEAQPLPDGAILRQQGETLRLYAAGSGGYSVTIEDASPPAHDFDHSNPGLKRIVIRMHTPAQSSAWLAVTAAPGSGNSDPVPSLAAW